MEKNYVVPEVEIIEVEVEKGFAQSPGVIPGGDIVPGEGEE